MDMFLVPIAYTHMCVYRRLLTPSGPLEQKLTDMSTQEKSGGTLSSAFTKGEYTYRRRDSAVATGDIRITDPKSPASLSIVMDPSAVPKAFPREYQVVDEDHPQS